MLLIDLLNNLKKYKKNLGWFEKKELPAELLQSYLDAKLSLLPKKIQKEYQGSINITFPKILRYLRDQGYPTEKIFTQDFFEHGKSAIIFAGFYDAIHIAALTDRLVRHSYLNTPTNLSTVISLKNPMAVNRIFHLLEEVGHFNKQNFEFICRVQDFAADIETEIQRLASRSLLTEDMITEALKNVEKAKTRNSIYSSLAPENFTKETIKKIMEDPEADKIKPKLEPKSLTIPEIIVTRSSASLFSSSTPSFTPAASTSSSCDSITSGIMRRGCCASDCS